MHVRIRCGASSPACRVETLLDACVSVWEGLSVTTATWGLERRMPTRMSARHVWRRAPRRGPLTVSRLRQKVPRACSVESKGRVLHSSVCHVRARHVADLYELGFRAACSRRRFGFGLWRKLSSLLRRDSSRRLCFSLGGPFGSDCNLDSSATCCVPGGLPVATFCIPTTCASRSQAQGRFEHPWPLSERYLGLGR